MEEHGVFVHSAHLCDMTRYREADAAESGGRGRRYSWKLVTSQRQMLRQSPLSLSSDLGGDWGQVGLGWVGNILLQPGRLGSSGSSVAPTQEDLPAAQPSWPLQPALPTHLVYPGQ